MPTVQTAFAEVNTGTLIKSIQPFAISYGKPVQAKNSRIVNRSADEQPVSRCETTR